jgi:hypothetical protein
MLCLVSFFLRLQVGKIMVFLGWKDVTRVADTPNILRAWHVDDLDDRIATPPKPFCPILNELYLMEIV